MLAKDILAYHYSKIPGIKTVKKYAPRTIKDAQLPMIVLFADPLETVSRASGQTTKNRAIRAVLFVESFGMGTETSAYEKTDPFFDSVEDYFEARETLALANGTTVLTHEYQDDEGETVTPYPTGSGNPGQFWTITFNHQLTIIKRVQYESGE